jgi:hypothetical protein
MAQAQAPITENMHDVLIAVLDGETDLQTFDQRTVNSLRNRGLLAQTKKGKVTAAGKKALAAHVAENH